jgi:hypothetical protein
MPKSRRMVMMNGDEGNESTCRRILASRYLEEMNATYLLLEA